MVHLQFYYLINVKDEFNQLVRNLWVFPYKTLTVQQNTIASAIRYMAMFSTQKHLQINNGNYRYKRKMNL